MEYRIIGNKIALFSLSQTLNRGLMKLILWVSIILLFFGCAKKEDSDDSDSSSSSSGYTRTSTPTAMTTSVPSGMSASTIKTSSRTANAYASSGPCQNVSQTGASEIPNNKVAVGCETLAKATGILGNSILTGDFYLNFIDKQIASGVTTSSECKTATASFSNDLYESMKSIATTVGIDESDYSNFKDSIGTSQTLYYIYNTSSDSDYTYGLKVAESCDKISSSSGVHTYSWNSTSNNISVGFEDTNKNEKGVFTYDPTSKRSTFRVTDQEQVSTPDGGTDNNTNNYTVTLKECSASESSTTSGNCAILKINLSITGKGVFPSNHQSNAGQSKTNSVNYYADGKVDDNGIFIKGTYSDFTYAQDNRSNLVDNHTWIYEGSWNKTGITYVKQNMDGGDYSTFPSDGTVPTTYSQDSYSASSNTLAIDNNSMLPGSYVVVKDTSSDPNTAPHKVIGIIEKSHDNFTSDAWGKPSSSKLWVWDPVDKQYEADSNSVTIQ